MAELMEHVEALADQIGPRPVSTEEERQASLYIAQELTDLGLDVTVDEFATPTGTRWPYVVAFAAVIVGTILSGLGMFVEALSTPMFLLGLVLVAGGFAIYYTERANMSFLSRMRAGGVSQNVVAKYVPSSVARERSRRKIIIAAHVDTVRAEPQAMPSIVNRFPLIRKVLFYVMIALVAIYVIRLLPLPWPETVDMVLWVISLICCVLLLVCVGCIVATRFMPYVSGGNDNASSAAVMLDIARRLLDPAERERWAREQREIEVDVPVETLAPQSTGAFPAVSADNVIQLHDAAAAEEEGVIPEGAELEYLDEDMYVDEAEGEFELVGETVAMPAVAGAAAGSDETQVISFADYADANAEDELEPADEDAAETVDEADDDVDTVIEEFDAEFAGAYDDDEPELEPQVSEEAPEEAEPEQDELPEIPQDTDNVPLGGAWPQATEYEEVEEEPEEEESEFVPEFLRDPDEAVATGVPSWYTAAREKAAKERAAKEKAAEEAAEQAKPSETTAFRSRFADMPLPPETPAQPAEEPVAEEPEPPAEPAKPRRRLVDLHTGQDIVEEEQPADDEQAATDEQPSAEEQAQEGESADEGAAPEQAAESVAGAEAPKRTSRAKAEKPQIDEEDLFTFEFDDEQIDDISPDLTGSFAPVGDEPAARPQNLVSVIPSIGSSAAAEQDELDEPAKAGKSGRMPKVQRAKTAEQNKAADSDDKKAAEDAEENKPKVERRRPTARRVTEEFQPTRVTDEREEIELGSTRQMAAVSSSYEDTPQAAPKARRSETQRSRRSEEPRASRTGTQRPVSRTSQLGPTGGVSPAARTTTIDMSSRPGSTSSFPALTGSFPALTGTIPTVSEDDFGVSTGGDFLSPSNDAFAPSSPAMTGTIDIPDSAFHNAVENVGGLFSKFGRKNKNTRRDEFGADDQQSWGEDDDFGWKGGGYFTDDSGLVDAARKRAAEIRESVISMTESDLLDKEVWFVALGASNANGQGMKNFLDLHQSELRGSLIINLECVGSGDIRYVDYEGTGSPRRADRRLMNLVKKASRAIAGKEMKSQSMTWRNTDATYAMLSGMRAISIMGFDGVAPEGWHWSTDTADIVNPEKLDYVSKLLLKVIENS